MPIVHRNAAGAITRVVTVAPPGYLAWARAMGHDVEEVDAVPDMPAPAAPAPQAGPTRAMARDAVTGAFAALYTRSRSPLAALYDAKLAEARAGGGPLLAAEAAVKDVAVADLAAAVLARAAADAAGLARAEAERQSIQAEIDGLPDSDDGVGALVAYAQAITDRWDMTDSNPVRAALGRLIQETETRLARMQEMDERRDRQAAAAADEIARMSVAAAAFEAETRSTTGDLSRRITAWDEQIAAVGQMAAQAVAHAGDVASAVVELKGAVDTAQVKTRADLHEIAVVVDRCTERLTALEATRVPPAPAAVDVGH
jgi:hypothetical protein